MTNRPRSQPTAILIADVGFGDAGKGLVSDYLAREGSASPPLIIRYCGGPNAGHNVVTESRHHTTFVQVGAGSLVRGVETYLSPHMFVNPELLMFECSRLSEAGVDSIWQRLLIDREAKVITPFHVSLNRLRELILADSAIGSTGQGIVEAVREQSEPDSDTLAIGDLTVTTRSEMKLKRNLEWVLSELARLDVDLAAIPPKGLDVRRHFEPERLTETLEVYRRFMQMPFRLVGADNLPQLFARDHLVLEGAQGVLLDPVIGFAPHTTSTRTTFANAELLLATAGFCGAVKRIGVTRTYATRHGKGPLVSETGEFDDFREPHNHHNPDQGSFRAGHIDMVMQRYACRALAPLDGLFVTHCDRFLRRAPSAVLAYRAPEASLANSKFFEFEADSICDVRFDPEPPRSRQIELGQQLEMLTPIVTPLDSVDELTILIARETDTPIVAMSYGPTARDVELPGGALWATL